MLFSVKPGLVRYYVLNLNFVTTLKLISLSNRICISLLHLMLIKTHIQQIGLNVHGTPTTTDNRRSLGPIT